MKYTTRHLVIEKDLKSKVADRNLNFGCSTIGIGRTGYCVTEIFSEIENAFSTLAFIKPDYKLLEADDAPDIADPENLTEEEFALLATWVPKIKKKVKVKDVEE